MSGEGWLIQARNGGSLRDTVTAERALNITIEGQPDNFNVGIGVGKWIQNAAVTAAEILALSELFLPLDVSEMAWTVHVENKIVRKLDELVQAAPVAAR
jgi:hypothetical protein